MEQFRRYFGSIVVVYIVEDGLESKIFDVFASVCPKMTRMSLAEALSAGEPIRAHFAVIELQKASKTSLESVLAKVSALESLVFCDNPQDGELLHFAIRKKIDIMGRALSAKELGEKLKEIIFSVSAKQKERARHDNYAKLVENGGALFCIKRGGKIVFANSELLGLFGAQSVSELDKYEEHTNDLLDFLVGVAQDEEDSFFIKTQNDGSYVANIKVVQNEQLILCIKTELDVGGSDGYLGHTDFIEILKNTLLQREANDEPTFAVTVKLENAAKVITDFGNEFFYAYFKKFSSFCGFFFEKDPFVFWYFDYIVILPQMANEDAVKAAAEELFAQSGQFECDKEVAPFVNISVLSLAHLSVNGSISLLENVYTKSQTQVQSAKILLTLSSTSVSVGNGQMAMYHIQNIADKGYPIKLLNIYKGLSIVSASKIIKVADGDIYVQTEKIQKYLMHTEKSVIIQSEHTPKEIFAEVRHVDTVEHYAILRNPIFLEFSANNRKSVRVQCDTRVPITVSSNKFTFTGEIFDISVYAIAVKYKNRINGDIAGTEVKLSFSLPSKESENGIEKVVLLGQITVVKNMDDHMMVIVSVKMEPQSEEVVLEYIYTRQKELIAEIKKLGGMIFK